MKGGNVEPVVLVVVHGGVVTGVFVDGKEVDPVLLDYDNIAEEGGLDCAGAVSGAADRFLTQYNQEMSHQAQKVGAWHSMINALEPKAPRRLEDVNDSVRVH